MPITPVYWTPFLMRGFPLTIVSASPTGQEIWPPILPDKRGEICAFLRNNIHDKEYFGMKSLLKTGNLFGLPYIYGTLTNSGGRDPLDFPALMKNPAEYQAVVTNAETGKPEYYGKEMMSQDDYRLIMASSAIPAACRPVELKGTFYYDGGISDAIPVDHALAEGCDRLVVILSKTGIM